MPDIASPMDDASHFAHADAPGDERMNFVFGRPISDLPYHCAALAEHGARVLLRVPMRDALDELDRRTTYVVTEAEHQRRRRFRNASHEAYRQPLRDMHHMRSAHAVDRMHAAEGAYDRVDGKCVASHHAYNRHGKRNAWDDAQSCSQTACDLASVNEAYVQGMKDQRVDTVAVEMKILLFAPAEGVAPRTSRRNAVQQMAVMQDAYAPAGIVFNWEVVVVVDAELWAKSLQPKPIDGRPGAHRCDEALPSADAPRLPACKYAEFGYQFGAWLCKDRDGCAVGDKSCVCLEDEAGNRATRAYCLGDGKSNKQCDAVCNLAEFAWDSGQCCSESAPSPLCFDPDYFARGGARIRGEDFVDLVRKRVPAAKGDGAFVVVPHPWVTFESALGVAAFPWDTSDFYLSPGWALINSYKQCWGVFPEMGADARLGYTAVHEVGHALGLYHTFQGIEQLQQSLVESPRDRTKQDVCQDACAERGASRTSGDFCSDTDPTPRNTQCAPPCGCERCSDNPFCSGCGGKAWTDAFDTYRNVMGYAPDPCMRARAQPFTPQQYARARCYFDARYLSTVGKHKQPAPIHIAPLATAGGAPGKAAITVEWTYPVSFGELGEARVSFELERWQVRRGTGEEVSDKARRVIGAGFADPSDVRDAARHRLVFQSFVDTSDGLSPDRFFQYRVRMLTDFGPARRWSPWSAIVAPSLQVGCPGDCHGHGKCERAPAGTGSQCQCDAGWSAGPPQADGAPTACELPDACDEDARCLLKWLNNGRCDDGAGCAQCKRAPKELVEKERVDCQETEHEGCEKSHPECLRAMWANTVCDSECNVEECNYDFGDCIGCSSSCPLAFVGDGVCQQACNTPACDFDAGDCKPDDQLCNWNGTALIGKIGCYPAQLGDTVCDRQCNTPACGNDKGDCSDGCAPGCSDEMIGNNFCDKGVCDVVANGVGVCTLPDDPTNAPDGGDCTECAPGCAFSHLGDGRCDRPCQVERCNFDVKDCLNCPCANKLLGNSRCDEPCNTYGCDYDGGDCPRPSKGNSDVVIYVSVGIASACCLFVVVPVILCVLYQYLVEEKEDDEDDTATPLTRLRSLTSQAATGGKDREPLLQPTYGNLPAPPAPSGPPRPDARVFQPTYGNVSHLRPQSTPLSSAAPRPQYQQRPQTAHYTAYTRR